MISEDAESLVRREREDPSSKVVGDCGERMGDSVGVDGGVGVSVEAGEGESWSVSRAFSQIVGGASDKLDSLEARWFGGSGRNRSDIVGERNSKRDARGPVPEDTMVRGGGCLRT